MTNDLNMAMFKATFKLEQFLQSGGKTVGTGWLVNMSEIMGQEKIALVTAFHVFDQMPKDYIDIHWRRLDDNGNWQREPQSFKIRDGAKGLWHHPENYDIAVMWIDPPEGPKKAAIPFSYLADETALKTYEIGPGDELLALGYPRGLSANSLGFPILRSGRVASFPLWPVSEFTTFLMDFSVFAGNSGGPVYMSERVRKRIGANETHEAHILVGMLAQQVMLSQERLEIGIVLHAHYIREALLALANRV